LPAQLTGATAENMHSQQITWNLQTGLSPTADDPETVALVFYFGTREVLACGSRYRELQKMFPNAHILGSKSGICELHNQTMAVTSFAEVA
jgi:hypothetical protein